MEYIHDNKVLYLKEVSDKWMTMKLRPNGTLQNFFSRVDALCVKYLTTYQIKKLDPEILALVMKELPNELKYHLSLLEGSKDGMRSWQWIKKLYTLLKNFPKLSIGNNSPRDTP